MEARWLTDDEQSAWRRFVAVLERLPGALDTQLSRDEGLTHFDYLTLAMLSEAPRRTLRMSRLAEQTSATLARLSNVARRLEARGLLRRAPCPEDGRATDVTLTDDGWAKVQAAAPGHVATVRRLVFDALGAAEVTELGAISERILQLLDPERLSVDADGEPLVHDG